MSIGVACSALPKCCDEPRDGTPSQVAEEVGGGPSQLEEPAGVDSFSVLFDKPPAPAANARGLVLALAQLQRELEPIAADVLGGEGRSLLEALEAENTTLRARLKELEARSHPSGFRPPGAAGVGSRPASSAAPVGVSVAAAVSFLEPEPETANMSDMSGDDASEASEGVLARVSAAPVPEARVSEIRTTRKHESVQMTDAPTRAFVINVRRLIEAQESFSLLHDLIQSTAMAALTLCSAGSQEQLTSTVCFLVFAIVIFFLHGHMWDTLDVSDLVMMLPVISDDDYKDTPNPNRLLKVLTFAQSNVPRYVRYMLDLAFAFICVFGWLLTVRAWEVGQGIKLQDTAEDSAVDRVCRYFVSEGADTDAEVLGMQVAIGTLMFILHILFKAAHQNETCAVMPATTEGRPWDPRIHGVPWRYMFFGGLPSMWFTSQEVLEDLKHYIYKANLANRVVHISAQEIAFYALSGQDELQATKTTLHEALLFDGRDRRLIGDKLNIDLCFFDSKLHTRGCAYPGEYLTLQDEEAAEALAPESVTIGRQSTPLMKLSSGSAMKLC